MQGNKVVRFRRLSKTGRWVGAQLKHNWYDKWWPHSCCCNVHCRFYFFCSLRSIKSSNLESEFEGWWAETDNIRGFMIFAVNHQSFILETSATKVSRKEGNKWVVSIVWTRIHTQSLIPSLQHTWHVLMIISDALHAAMGYCPTVSCLRLRGLRIQEGETKITKLLQND